MLASPKSAIDSRSIASPSASSVSRAVTLRASKPAIRARPTSSASATSRGSSSPNPDSADLAEAERGVEVELGRAQIGVEPRRPIAGGPGIGQAALDRAAVELGLQSLDRDPVGAERDIALGVPGLDLRGGGGAPGEPGHQVLRIVGIDVGAAGKAKPLADGIEPAVQLDLA